MIDHLYRLFSSDESGQTMAEYAVVLGVITVAVVGALTVLSGTISSVSPASPRPCRLYSASNAAPVRTGRGPHFVHPAGVGVTLRAARGI